MKWPLKKPLSRRNKYVMFDAEAVIEFLRTDLNRTGPDKWIHAHGLPPDAKVVGVHISHWPTTPYRFAIVLESESFPEVPHGEEIPELAVTLTTYEREPERGRDGRP